MKIDDSLGYPEQISHLIKYIEVLQAQRAAALDVAQHFQSVARKWQDIASRRDQDPRD